MSLTIDQVKHVAKLSNLQLNESEIVSFVDQLNKTIEYVEQLNEVDTTGLEPTSQVTGLMNVTRNDEIAPSLTQKQALQNTDNTISGYFKVPAVLEDI